MPGQARLDATGTLHHLIGRQVERDRGNGSEAAGVRVRRIFCGVTVRRLGYAGALVAEFFGVTRSLVNRYASSEGAGNLAQYS